jgi:hypothetical protein
MSELSIAELASEHAELLPQRETLSIIIINSSSIAIATHAHSTAVAVNVTNIDRSFDSHVNWPHYWLHHHHHHGGGGGDG